MKRKVKIRKIKNTSTFTRKFIGYKRQIKKCNVQLISLENEKSQGSIQVEGKR